MISKYSLQGEAHTWISRILSFFPSGSVLWQSISLDVGNQQLQMGWNSWRGNIRSDFLHVDVSHTSVLN